VRPRNIQSSSIPQQNRNQEIAGSEKSLFYFKKYGPDRHPL